MKYDLISVIVPIYNSELYLSRCIDSIIYQTYKNLEIILVDDGSTDKSGEICDNYEGKDCRIKVIHKTNGGAATARNVGLEAAKGQFIGFVDSDDAILDDMYETLLLYMKNDVDIVTCGRYVYQEGSDSLRRKAYCAKKIIKYSNDQAVGELLKNEIFAYGVNEKIYRRELFENVSFPCSRIAEDLPVTYALFKKSRNVVNIGESKYCNYLRKNSSSNSEDYFLRMKYLCFLRDILLDIKKEYPQHLKLAEAQYIRNACWILRTIKQCENRSQYIELEKRLTVFMKKMFLRLALNARLSIEEKIYIIKNVFGET